MDVLGFSEHKLKCRFCNNKPVAFKIGSIEVDNGYVVSIRLFMLCDKHKDEENYEQPINKIMYN